MPEEARARLGDVPLCARRILRKPTRRAEIGVGGEAVEIIERVAAPRRSGSCSQVAASAW